MAIQNPVIVVGGIPGSVLNDTYPVTPETVWGIGVSESARIVVHPEDWRYEGIEPARVRSTGLYSIPYGELVDELRQELTEKAGEPTPVFPFGYDWRQPLETTEAELGKLVDEVITRTLLRKNYYNDKAYASAPKVDLIGHSMGGLIITGYLQSKGSAARVGKVVTLATPFRGSVEAPFKMAAGGGLLGFWRGKESERETARLTPALYYLVPSFAGAATSPDGAVRDLFDPDTWQTSILKTLERFIKEYGVKGGEPAAQARKLLADMLERAKANRARIEGFKPADANLAVKDWLAIVGVNEDTRVSMRVIYTGADRDFEFSDEDCVNDWTSSDPSRKVYTGDGTVPFLGATAAFIPTKSMVCISADDLGKLEVGDKTLVMIEGFHAIIPKLSLVTRLIVSHLTGKKVRNTWGTPAPGFTGTTWDPPIKGLEPR